MRLVVFALLVGCASAPPVPPPRYEIKLPDKHARLPNGMRVILLPDPTSSVVEVDTHYEVGSNEDPFGKAGLAHLVEHLMFQLRAAEPPALAEVLAQHSVFHNAFTVSDYTHYVDVARPEELGSLLAIEASRLSLPCESIDQATFEREREVVRNEIRQRLGTPEAQARAVAQAIAYPNGHPYSHTAGGDDMQIASLTLKDACQFIADYYTPDRATVVIGGRVAEKDAAAAVDRTLAALPARTAKPRAAVPPLEIHPKEVTIEADVDKPMVYGLWALPPKFSADGHAIGDIAGMLRRSIARAALMNNLATRISVSVFGGELAPVLAVVLELKDDADPKDVIAAFRRSANHVAYGYHSSDLDEAYDRGNTLIVGEIALDLEALSERTLRFAQYAQFDADGKGLAGELVRTRTRKHAEIIKIVERVLDPERGEYVIVTPKKGARRYGRADVALAAGGGGPAEDLPIDRSEAGRALPVPDDTLAQGRRFVLPNGLTVVLLPIDEQVPVLTAAMVIGAGSAADPPGKAGLADIVAGTRPVPSASESGRFRSYGNLFDAYGIQYGETIFVDFTAFTARGLAPYQEVLLQGLAHRFTEDRDRWIQGFAKTGEAREKELGRSGVRAAALAQKRRAELVYGADHPYARSVMPTKQSFESMGHEDVSAFIARYYVAANATLVVAGQFDATAAEATIRKAYAEMPRGQADTAAIPAPKERTSPSYVGIVGRELPVVRVTLAYPSRAPAASHAARLVLTQILNHRVAAIRDKLGASYGIHAALEHGVGASAYTIDGAVDAPRAGEALAAIRTAIDGLRQGDGLLDDFVRARRDVLRGLVIDSNDSRKLASMVAKSAGFRAPLTEDTDLRHAVASLTPNAVLALINADLRLSGEVIVAVGGEEDLKRMYDRAGLKGASIER